MRTGELMTAARSWSREYSHTMGNTRHNEFKQIVRQLVAQGEDKEEMDYWVDIFPDLPSGQQKEMLDLFKKELEALKAEG